LPAYRNPRYVARRIWATYGESGRWVKKGKRFAVLKCRELSR